MENGDFKDVDGDTLAKEYYTMDDLPLNNKTVLMRVDINSTIDLKNKEIKGRELRVNEARPRTEKGNNGPDRGFGGGGRRY